MKIGLFFLMVCGVTQSLFATDVITTGKIGNYPIEVTVENVDWVTGEVIGKYRYQNKTSYLTLAGQLYGSCVYLEESYHDKKSGTFYLDYNGEALSGKWIHELRAMDVSIDWTTELSNKLKYKQIGDYSAETNSTITGTYKTENYFLNDMWFTPENPQMEIGFNGGFAMIEEIHPDSIHFLVEVTCGPTYHIAYAQGKAAKIGSDNYYCLFNVYEGDSCEIYFNFSEKEAAIYTETTNVYSCEFGARAYLEHDFLKVDDAVDFSRAE